MAAKIGVFWVYKGEVLGRAVSSTAGDESLPGLRDSSDNHVDLWDNDLEFLKDYPKLKGTDYFLVPRGRVLWDENNHKAIVYMDKVLFEPEIKESIRMFFNLYDCEVSWKTDPHYTTQAGDVANLFRDDW